MSKISPFFINIKEVSRKEILEALAMFYPKGSGPLSMMRICCGLLLNIAELRGFTITEQDIRALRNVTEADE